MPSCGRPDGIGMQHCSMEAEMDTEINTELLCMDYAEVLARKAVEGFQQATQRCDGDWVGETFDAFDLVAMTDIIDDPAYEGIIDAVCDVIDGWGGPWVRTLSAEDHL
jgi:hypothetical protein